MGANTIGSNNTALGQEALSLNTDGYNNTALGKDSLYYNVNGAGNTAVGYRSWARGSFNTTLGEETS